MARQKPPNASRAIVEQWGVPGYIEATRAIAATQQLVSFGRAIIPFLRRALAVAA